MSKKLVSIYTILGALLTVLILLALFGLVTRVVFPQPANPVIPTPILHVVNRSTPTLPITSGGTPAPGITPTLNPTKYAGIDIGKFVQIVGTDGDGLRLRSGPGTSNPPLFLGLDAEVFQVKDGPREQDGMIWWHIVSPSDENRNGWASAVFLEVIPSH